jgi:uncharacterized spore protein YtfJ
MSLKDLTDTARDALDVRRVYAEPFERDGVAFIAAASVSGGGGGGNGTDEQGAGGEGGGFGLNARPAGAYVITDGRVRWRPAVDVNRLVTAAAAVVVALMVTRLRLAGLRARQQRHQARVGRS